jgi:hypothetical protein
VHHKNDETERRKTNHRLKLAKSSIEGATLIERRAGVTRIELTEYFQPKSEDSAVEAAHFSP